MNENIIKQIYPMICQRKSIRNYKSEELSDDILNELMEFWDSTLDIFPEEPVSIELLTEDQVVSSFPISFNAKYYLSVCANNNRKARVNVGFKAQQLDLWFSSKGLGSCWLYMVHPVKEHQVFNGLPHSISISFGIPDEKLHREDISEFNRKTLSEITNGGKYDDILESVRIAPSSTNIQAWYFKQNDNSIEVYIKKPLRAILLRPMVKLYDFDIGIALCHLYLAREESGRFNEFSVNIDSSIDNSDYILTVLM